MKNFRHPDDPPEFLFPRTVGKRGGPSWQAAAVADAAPEMLEGVNEDVVRDLIERDIKATGSVYVTFEEPIYAWLKKLAGQDVWQAKALLATLKDFPDFLVLRKLEGVDHTAALVLELKRQKKNDGGRPGQRRLATAIGGHITEGYVESKNVLDNFIKSTKGNP